MMYMPPIDSVIDTMQKKCDSFGEQFKNDTYRTIDNMIEPRGGPTRSKGHY